MNTSYIEVNKKSWNKCATKHLKSDFYDNDSFMKGRCTLPEVDVNLLGDVVGKDILHLQCHFGQDTLSLERRGANVVGVDFSNEAIKIARNLNHELSLNAEFIESDVYSLRENLSRKFDIVYTSYGALCWLPNLNLWAAIVEHFLKPNGKLILVEFHPFIGMYDDAFDEIIHKYHSSETIMETSTTTYADNENVDDYNYLLWNHGMAAVMQSLIDQNLIIKHFKEYNYSPYDCFSHTHEYQDGRFRISKFKDNIPLTYSIKASKSFN